MSLMPNYSKACQVVSVDTVNTGDAVITNADAKAWARTDEDLTDLIAEITDQAEQLCNASFIDKTVTATFEPTGSIAQLPFGPVKAITSVTPSVDYQLSGAEIQFKTTPTERFTVVYTTGYAEVPAGVRLALRKATLSNLEDRQDNALSSVSTMPNHSRKQLLRYKRF